MGLAALSPQAPQPVSRPTPHAQYLEALGIDLFVPRQPLRSVAQRPAMVPVPPVTPSAPPLASDEASAWAQLEAEVSVCTRCALSRSRTHTVFGVGNRHTELLLVGEAPGADEDAQGEPFVGRAGQLLNAILRGMRWPRPTVFIANVLKCRPPGNRDPLPEEAACCTPYLHRQIALIQPLMILAVGRIAAQTLLGTDAPIGKLRGVVHRFGPRRTPLIATYHPSYLLRSPGEKRRVWVDMKFLRAELARARAGGPEQAH
jgi:DNA polymerase